MSILLSNPLIQLKIQTKSRATTSIKSSSISARLDNSQQPEQQLNLSVLRFTFGIPGFDESYLPRWIGYGFGSLLVLNHFVFSNSGHLSAAGFFFCLQRAEGLGLSLAAFSVVLPYLGNFLKGATPVDQKILPENTEQIFVMSQNISDTLKEDMAWATYVLLRNTNSISVLISFRGELCIRGYWNTPDGSSKTQLVEWFERQIEKIGLSDLKESLYFPQSADSGLWKMLPKETSSLFVQPVIQIPNPSANEMEKTEGFVLLASSIRYAYSDKDRAWIRAIANKFRGKAYV
ncbi:hypothetical protein Patl1_20071 [Pistacia atlantica]|uniref:Uncharacterized protein n=1 Tax=Pistacia atlantica TaxID=434234 RepID=A0ACC1BM01_9ROSI|nr:hypothetical protein Patl1_20071 [Pistacia atlantica]